MLVLQAKLDFGREPSVKVQICDAAVTTPPGFTADGGMHSMQLSPSSTGFDALLACFDTAAQAAAQDCHTPDAEGRNIWRRCCVALASSETFATEVALASCRTFASSGGYELMVKLFGLQPSLHIMPGEPHDGLPITISFLPEFRVRVQVWDCYKVLHMQEEDFVGEEWLAIRVESKTEMGFHNGKLSIIHRFLHLELL